MLIFVSIALWGCSAEHIKQTVGQTETVPTDNQAVSGNYWVEDFFWIIPGEHTYWDIIDAMPVTSDETVVKASKNSFSYPLIGGGKIVFWFDSELIVNVVWHVQKDGTVCQLIPAIEQ